LKYPERFDFAFWTKGGNLIPTRGSEKIYVSTTGATEFIQTGMQTLKQRSFFESWNWFFI